MAGRDGIKAYALVVVGIALAIVLPFLIFGAQIESTAVACLSSAADRPFLVAVFVILLLAGDTVLPVPSSVLSVSSGALLGFSWGATASAVGMTIGCAFGYWLGRSSARRLRRVLGDLEMEVLSSAFSRHGDWVVLLGRGVPVFAESTTIFAGLHAMPPGRFLALTALANIGVSMSYAWVGAHAATVNSFAFAFVGAVLVPAGPLLWLRAVRRRSASERLH